MKFKFKIQQYQTDAVENTVAVFSGQPSHRVAEYRRDLGKRTQQQINFEGEIPGASASECGNYSEQNLNMAKYYIKKYKASLEKDKNFKYN